jgi:hypothetical protein
VQKLTRPGRTHFDIPTYAEGLDRCKKGAYEHWMGLLMFGDIGIARAQVSANYVAAHGHPGPVAKDPPQPQTASTFFNQPMFFWKGEFYTRADVIKIHANKLGGVHLDFKRAEAEEHILEFKRYFGFDLQGRMPGDRVPEELRRGPA